MRYAHMRVWDAVGVLETAYWVKVGTVVYVDASDLGAEIAAEIERRKSKRRASERVWQAREGDRRRS